ncbi:MAG: proline--tRNA ligase [Elusimicrobiota bacterium]
MKLSNSFIPTLREDPKEAEIPSHRLMVRAGMIRKLASGVYEFLPLGWKVVKKIENIIRQEMDRIGGQEMMMSAMQPKNIWEMSGRWDLYGDELIRFKDRKEREFCLGPTHEEVITYLVKTNINSYKDLPLLLYQFQMKYRDEIRPRFGIMRAREFYMKDAYSFDVSEEGCEKSYQMNYNAYNKIFERCGLDFIPVEAETGNIGGKFSHEFMVIADTGEEEISFCDCGYGANSNLARYKRNSDEMEKSDEKELSLEEVHTPDMKTVQEVSEFIGEKPEKFIKTLIYIHENGPIVFLIRGDHELNENKISVKNLELADESTIEKVTGGPLGFSGPVGIDKSKIYKIYADRAVVNMKNAISGANKKDYHLKNINPERDFDKNINVGDIRKVRHGDRCPDCGKKLKFKRGIEVGHTFLLGTKYSDSMEAKYTDAHGEEKGIIMGCYGIGVTRIAAAAIEQSHDENGIIWPKPLAPFDLVILQLSESEHKFCNDLYEKLNKKYDVLWDDRDETPGVKFNDAQLIGIPIQIVVGRRFKKTGELEVQDRKTGEKKYIQPENIEQELNNL